jgi:hypothetical protein
MPADVEFSEAAHAVEGCPSIAACAGCSGDVIVVEIADMGRSSSVARPNTCAPSMEAVIKKNKDTTTIATF